MPLFDPSTTNHLKPWLIKSLEPICDADPEVLSEYVLALLKHDAPESELRAMFMTQLQDFLEEEVGSFVDTLFQVLRSRSYLPYDDGSPLPKSASASNGIHIPLDALVTPSSGPRGQKRSADSDEPRHPPKGPRMSDGGRYPGRAGGGSRGGPRGNRGGYSGPGRGKGLPRERCRDYYNKGFCSRGELCPFDHGDEAIMPPMPFVPPPFGPVQMMEMMQQGFQMPWMIDSGTGGQYDPNHASMDISQPPEYTNERRTSKIGTPTDAVELGTSEGGHHSADSMPSGPDGHNPAVHLPSYGSDTHGVNGHSAGRGVGSLRGRGRGRGGRGSAPSKPGTFPDAENAQFENPSSTPSRGENKTIVVEKIPTESLSLEGVNDWFKKFGPVTNVAIDKPSAKALVSFQNHPDAYRAWKSEEAVFGNRFVKVFWHRPLTGHGAAGAKLLAASAPVVQGLNQKPSNQHSSPSAPPPTDRLARSQELDRLIVEQKSLMDSIGLAPPEEKKVIMTRLRELNEKMKDIASSNPEPPPATASIGRESKLREKLDRELELARSGAPPPDTPMEGDQTDQTDLMAELAELRKKAAEVGVSAGEIQGIPSRGRGFPRGRGRGRGYFPSRGRGGALIKNISLDNRTRRLAVKGLNADDDHALTKLEEWYKSVGGELESFQVISSDEVQVQFRTRALAEQALGKGTSIPDIGSVQVSWHSTPKTTASTPLSSTSNVSGSLLVSNAAEGPENTSTVDEKVEIATIEGTNPGKADAVEAHDAEHYDDGWGADQFND